MKWFKYTIKTVSDAADIIAASLYDIGVEGVEIEEDRPPSKEDLEEMFSDFYPEYESSDNTAYIHFYLEPEEGIEKKISEVSAVLEELKGYSDIGEASISVSSTEDKDWINSWKEFFHKFVIDDILIIPSWESEENSDEYSLVLHIDPGTAFGTGMHETTRLAIRQLRKYNVPGCCVFDVGTGSGILGITALKSGAAYVKAVDIDPNAVPAVSDNLKSNDVDEELFDLVIGNIINDDRVMDISDDSKYDIVTANMLAEILIPLAPVIGRYMKPGALIITSGILENKTDQVKDAFSENGFETIDTMTDGEWVSVVFRKRAE